MRVPRKNYRFPSHTTWHQRHQPSNRQYWIRMFFMEICKMKTFRFLHSRRIEIQANFVCRKLPLCFTWNYQPTSLSNWKERDARYSESGTNRESTDSSMRMCTDRCIGDDNNVWIGCRLSRLPMCVCVHCLRVLCAVSRKVVFNCVYVSLDSVRLLTPRWMV